jgi:hypothetical protein
MSLPTPAPFPPEASTAALAAVGLRPGRYRHYKGKDYRVIGLAHHSETEEALVVYQLLYGDFSLWVRPASMFAQTVTLADGTEIPRFVYVGPT